YEVKGDELRVCGDAVDTAQEKDVEARRPKEFDSNKGLLLVFKRENPRGPEKEQPAPAKRETTPGVDPWVPLFNGKDLTGWFVEGGEPQAWQVERGELLVDGTKSSRRYNWLLTEKKYSDFLLRFEYQLSEKGTSGVALWA